MVEFNTQEDDFLVQHTDFSLREQVKYPNGGTSRFYDNGVDMVIIDENICTHDTKDPVFSYMLITDKQNNYMHQFKRVFRFLGYVQSEVDKYLSNNEITLPVDYRVTVGDRGEQADVSPLEIDFEQNFSNASTGQRFRTIALNGGASEQERQNAFERLAMNEEDATADTQPLDYIFSVEILNEGVDIVEVNQVIMLRPTQSPIVFIQQLGRGLRKANGKEYVVILDFIGNYNNNFMIPIALSGDRTYNKDNIRRYIMEGGRIIPGASTVHFDEISRKKIFASVDNANFSDIKLIRENYTNLKNKLGRIPRLRDFDDYGEMDVLRIFDNNSLGSYYKFLVKYEKEYKVRLSEDEEKVIEFVSKKLASGKRIQELKMLKRMLAYAHGLSQTGLFAGLSEDMKEYGKNISQDQKENIVNVMTNEFPAGASKKTYSQH